MTATTTTITITTTTTISTTTAAATTTITTTAAASPTAWWGWGSEANRIKLKLYFHSRRHHNHYLSLQQSFSSFPLSFSLSLFLSLQSAFIENGDNVSNSSIFFRRVGSYFLLFGEKWIEVKNRGGWETEKNKRARVSPKKNPVVERETNSSIFWSNLVLTSCCF